MFAYVDEATADMAQLNVTVEEHILTAVDRLASDRQMSRPALVRALLDEALAADLVGRPLFAQPEAPPTPAIDPATLIALTGQLDKLTKRLNATLRAHSQRDEALMGQHALNTEAINAAQRNLVEQINLRMRDGVGPFRKEMTALGEVIAGQHEALAQLLLQHRDELVRSQAENAALAAISRELTRLDQSVRQARPNVTIKLFDYSRDFERWELAAGAVMALFLAFFVLVMIARILPDEWFAAPVCRAMFGNNQHAACALAGGSYSGDGSCRSGSGRSWP